MGLSYSTNNKRILFYVERKCTVENLVVPYRTIYAQRTLLPSWGTIRFLMELQFLENGSRMNYGFS